MFLAMVVVEKDDKEVGRLDFSNHRTGLDSAAYLSPFLEDARS